MYHGDRRHITCPKSQDVAFIKNNLNNIFLYCIWEKCFVCGKEGKLTEGRCKECYLKESFHFSIPGRIKVPYCKSCNSYYTNRWKTLDDKLSFIDEILKNNVSSSKEINFVPEFSKDVMT